MPPVDGTFVQLVQPHSMEISAGKADGHAHDMHAHEAQSAGVQPQSKAQRPGNAQGALPPLPGMAPEGDAWQLHAGTWVLVAVNGAPSALPPLPGPAYDNHAWQWRGAWRMVALGAESTNPKVNDHEGEGDQHTSGSRKRIPHVPQPQSFSGQDAYELNDALFAFENYLVGNSIPREKWACFAQPMLTGAALKQYNVYAKSLGTQPTWEQFKESLKVFAKPQEELKALMQLRAIKQTKSVREYVQTFNLLRAKSGNHSSERDLIVAFQQGLKDAQSFTINPATNAYWTSLDALVTYALSKEATLQVAAQGQDNKRDYGKTRHFLKVKPAVAKLKAAHVPVQGTKRKADGKENRDPKRAGPKCKFCTELGKPNPYHKGASNADECRNFGAYTAWLAKKGAN
jgi:hypothetical protein